MTLLELFGNKKEEKQNNQNSGTTDLTQYINDVINNKKWEQFIKDIRKQQGVGQNQSGFNIGDVYVKFRGDNGKASKDMLELSKAIRNAFDKNDEKLEQELTKLSAKNEKNRDFITAKIIPYLKDPSKLTSNISKNQNKGNLVDPHTYNNIGRALVYRSTEFVSKMADSKTKIDTATFNQLMIDAFNGSSNGGGENESFLMQFTNIDDKMRLDAAKNTVAQVEHNGQEKTDAEEQIGENPDKSDENNTDESYYLNIKNILNGHLVLEADEKEKKQTENVELPRRLSDFSSNAKTAMKQVNAVEKAWPRQFKTWYDKFQGAFEDGIKEGQDDVRNDNKKELTDPITGKKLDGRKALGTGGPNAFIRDHKYIQKLTDGIKNEKPVTIFNLGPKMILGLFDAIEHGGKILQSIKDDFGSAIHDIKKSLRSSTSVKDFNKQIDELTKNGQFGAANAVAQAAAVVQFTQLLTLLQNGPIGTLDLEHRTFSTAMSNSQTSIEVAMQNLLASMDKYTDTAKRFEENKDVKVSEGRQDAKLDDGSSEKKEEKKEEQPTNGEEPEKEDGDD